MNPFTHIPHSGRGWRRLRLTVGCLLACVVLQHPAMAQPFMEIAHQAGIDHRATDNSLMGGGVAWFDYDNDGDIDLYFTGGRFMDALYRNNGDGTFTEVTQEAGFSVTQQFQTLGVVTGDIDNDGDRDVFVTTKDRANLLFLNNGDGTFTDISESAGIIHPALSASAAFADLDGDGHLDIYVANHVRNPHFIKDDDGNLIGFAHQCFPNFLYMNNGDRTFWEAGTEFHLDHVGCGLAVAFTDYDNDGDPDLYVANDFGAWLLPNVLYNNRSGVFTDVSVPSGADAKVFGMGIAVGDYDNDGDMDMYVTNIGPNVLYRNNGDGTFQNVAGPAGVADARTPDSLFTVGWGATFADFDNDGDLDLFVSNGFIHTADFIPSDTLNASVLYANNGDGTFTDISAAAGIADAGMQRGCAVGDYDNDGDLDLVVASIHTRRLYPGAHALLYRNDRNTSNHWIEAALRGTRSNRDAFGARVSVFAGGRRRIREVRGGGGYLSQRSSVVHVGLGVQSVIDSIVVEWPAGGRDVVTQPAADAVLEIVEGEGAVATTGSDTQEETATQIPDAPVLHQNYPNPLNPATLIMYELPEPTDVRLSIYNIKGQEVRILIHARQGAGMQSVRWDGRDRAGNRLPSGIYIYRLQAGKFVDSKKMILLK